ERYEADFQRQVGRHYRSRRGKEQYHFPDGSIEEITVIGPRTKVTPEIRAQSEAFEDRYHILRSYTRPSNPIVIMGGEATLPKEGHYQSQVNQAFLKYLEHPNET